MLAFFLRDCPQWGGPHMLWDTPPTNQKRCSYLSTFYSQQRFSNLKTVNMPAFLKLVCSSCLEALELPDEVQAQISTFISTSKFSLFASDFSTSILIQFALAHASSNSGFPTSCHTYCWQVNLILLAWATWFPTPDTAHSIHLPLASHWLCSPPSVSTNLWLFSQWSWSWYPGICFYMILTHTPEFRLLLMPFYQLPYLTLT